MTGSSGSNTWARDTVQEIAVILRMAQLRVRIAPELSRVDCTAAER